jgi:2,4-dienoyl-CoA reductase-like NADH-dependent reductase (Old Yellow Enzyme family)
MDRLFEPITLEGIKLANRFVFPPIKLGYGNPDGSLSDRQLTFYEQIAQEGAAFLILEPVPVTPEEKEHPKQLCVHNPESETELKKIVEVIQMSLFRPWSWLLECFRLKARLKRFARQLQKWRL